jgi:uncharacterized repeat protein (TIGR03803 family)
LVLANAVSAQVLTTLHSFTALTGSAETNSDGATPIGTLVLSGNTLYGTASYGGIGGAGTLFAIDTNDGASFTPLHSFTGTFTGSYEGGGPEAGVIISGGILYGTTEYGGTAYNGTLFSIATNGTSFTTIHALRSAGDGGSPQSSLILSSNILYGTASSGGSGIGDGTVFAVDTGGTNFVPLYSFSDIKPPGSTNNDGADSTAPLILSGTNLYGVAFAGGPTDNGTVFSLSLDGTVFKTLHGFKGNDGANPSGGLVLSGNTLYGIGSSGGASGEGAIFALNTDGGGFTNLYSFSSIPRSAQTNSDGAGPSGPLVLSGNTLYGTAGHGGRWGNGTVFALNTNGTGFATLYSFSASFGFGFSATNSDGVQPSAGLILSDNALYGTAAYGGIYGHGTVFSLSLGPASIPPPELTIVRAGTNVIVTWATSDVGFTLQSTTNLASPAVWSAVAGQFAVTNPIAGTAMLYRLSK